MYRNYKLYLKDILNTIESIEKFVEGMDFEEFKRDDKTSSAVIRKFEIIGEATKNIPDEIRQQYPQIPWQTRTQDLSRDSRKPEGFLRRFPE